MGAVEGMRKKPLFILGPTGCGKSALAVEVARLLGRAEIISADAYQVYRGMEVLTAASSAEERCDVPHHLVSFLDPSQNNDAATHARRAEECIRDVQRRGCVPIVTGGSGLYVKFISHGISPAPPGDPHLRAELAALPLEELVRRLQEADPAGAAATHLQNPRYVARNLEIVLLGGKPLSFWQNNWKHPAAGPGFHLVRETADLDARIARRSRRMLSDGAIEEVSRLLERGKGEGGDGGEEKKTLSPTAEKTLGFELIGKFLRGELTRAELEERLARTTRQYAKRQRTWLRRESWLKPIPASATLSPRDCAARLVQELEAGH